MRASQPASNEEQAADLAPSARYSVCNSKTKQRLAMAKSTSGAAVVAEAGHCCARLQASLRASVAA
jgi:hypothetical protein